MSHNPGLLGLQPLRLYGFLWLISVVEENNTVAVLKANLDLHCNMPVLCLGCIY